MGIVGAGNIGSQAGQLGAAWGMNVVGCVETWTREKADRLRAKGIELTTFDDVLEKSDFISIHVPKQKSTHNLIDEAALKRVKQGAFLVNLARGGVVDEAALLRALNEGRLRGAGLDVHVQEGPGKTSPLAELENVILTPHIGAGTFDSRREIGDVIIERIEAFGRP